MDDLIALANYGQIAYDIDFVWRNVMQYCIHLFKIQQVKKRKKENMIVISCLLEIPYICA